MRRYHRHHGTSGHIWQGRFKSFIVKDDDHLLKALRYVEGNPVQARMVTSARDWPWSSHRENLGEVERTLTDDSRVKLPADWSTHVDTPLTGSELDSPKRSIHQQVPFGLGTDTGAGS